MGRKRREPAPPIAEAAVPWRTVLLCCRKCARKLDGGFGPDGKHDFTETLKRLLRERGQRRLVRLVETPCLGLCPKDAVTVLRADEPDHALIVSRGTDPVQLAERLLPPPACLTPAEPTSS